MTLELKVYDICSPKVFIQYWLLQELFDMGVSIGDNIWMLEKSFELKKEKEKEITLVLE